MIVAGIDPSLTNCGIAILQHGTPRMGTSVGHAGKDGASYDNRSDRIVSQARAILAAIETTLAAGRPDQRVKFYLDQHLDLAVIEGPAYGQNLPSNHDRAGLWWGLYSALRAKKIPTAVVNPATRAKWATGSGRAEKRDVLAAVRAWWPDHTIRNHDIADALVLAAIGAHHLGDPMPFPVKDRHTLSLEAINWPSISCAKPEQGQVNT